uniref:3-beta hydroxysteroid dehydrogenase/isomerase domain-containing protein n=1 Tax=Alexandrium monilatum TaxID=311494 RepID=A0A7S4Q1H7_9DINO
MLRLTRRLAAPRLPLVVGGAGQVGRKMLAALAEAGCTRARVLDASARPVERALAADLELEYTWHKLGHDSSEFLAPVLDGWRGLRLQPGHSRRAARDEGRAHARKRGGRKGDCGRVSACRCAEAGARFINRSDWPLPSVEATEEDALPPAEEYRSAYELSKRLGEEAVLAACSSELATVSLRACGILSGPWDYTFRAMWDRPGNVITLEGTAPLDFIAAEDLCRAALAAADRLQSPSVAGQVFFVTKGEAMRPERIAELIGEHLGWQVTKLPEFAQSCISAGMRVSHGLKELFGQPVPGVASYDYLSLARTQQTFDNSKAFHTLGFQSQVTLEECVARAVSEWRVSNPGK